MTYLSVRWRDFKTNLTNKYIFGDYQDRNPCDVYNFITPNQWELFRKSRVTPEFEVTEFNL